MAVQYTLCHTVIAFQTLYKIAVYGCVSVCVTVVALTSMQNGLKCCKTVALISLYRIYTVGKYPAKHFRSN